MTVDSLKNIAADVTSLSLQWLDKGFDLVKVPEDVAALRFSICRKCPSGKYEPNDKRCLECTCPNMDFKSSLKYDPIKRGFIGKKTPVTCPLGHW